MWDHFDAGLNTVLVESPGNFDAVFSDTPIDGWTGYSTYMLEITGATPAPVVGRTDPGLTKSVVCADLASRSFRRTHMTGSSPTAPARVRAVGEDLALPQW